MSDNIIQLNQKLIHTKLKNLVRNSVEETLNALLDHEAEKLINAKKYKRSSDRKEYPSGPTIIRAIFKRQRVMSL